MKPEEAIVWIKDTRYIYENMNPDIELSKLKCEAFNLAIEALEKQVAKPIKYATRCPTCDEIWYGYDDGYCNNCGQKLEDANYRKEVQE